VIKKTLTKTRPAAKSGKAKREPVRGAAKPKPQPARATAVKHAPVKTKIEVRKPEPKKPVPKNFKPESKPIQKPIPKTMPMPKLSGKEAPRFAPKPQDQKSAKAEPTKAGAPRLAMPLDPKAKAGLKVDPKFSPTNFVSIADQKNRDVRVGGAEPQKGAADPQGGRGSENTQSGGTAAGGAQLQIHPAVDFLLRNSYRELIRGHLIENQLDDRHDSRGTTIYLLKFDVAIVPGNNTRKRAFVRIRMTRDATPKIIESVNQTAKAPQRGGKSSVRGGTPVVGRRCSPAGRHTRTCHDGGSCAR